MVLLKSQSKLGRGEKGSTKEEMIMKFTDNDSCKSLTNVAIFSYPVSGRVFQTM